MIILRRIVVVTALGTLALPFSAWSQGAVQWGTAEKPKAARVALEGTNVCYDPTKVEQKDAAYAFTLYRTAMPGPADETGRYMLNCETRESVTIVNGQASAPEKILAGETLYVIGKKLCNWDPTNVIKKFFN